MPKTTAKTSEAKPIPPIGLRLPDEMRKWLKHQAVENDRSLNAEIYNRLKDSRKRQEEGHAA